MRIFKAGDQVKVKHRCSGARPNKIYTLIYWLDNLYTDIGQDGGCSCQDNWILISSKANKLDLSHIKPYGIVKFLKDVDKGVYSKKRGKK